MTIIYLFFFFLNRIFMILSKLTPGDESHPASWYHKVKNIIIADEYM